jgi:hypothetical protein
MNSPVSAPDQQPRVAQHKFAFVMNRRPLIQGTIGAVVILGLGFGWSWWTGRIKYVDATYYAILIASITLVPAFMLHRLLRGTRQAAATLGHIELDDSAARWLRPDATFGFNVSWSDVDHATFDQRNSTAVLFQRGGGAGVILGALGQYGTPSGSVVLERFDELVAVVSWKVPTSDHRAGTTRSRAQDTAPVLAISTRNTGLPLSPCAPPTGSVESFNV